MAKRQTDRQTDSMGLTRQMDISPPPLPTSAAAPAPLKPLAVTHMLLLLLLSLMHLFAQEEKKKRKKLKWIKEEGGEWVGGRMDDA